MSKPFIRNDRTAKLVALGVFMFGAWLMYNAYEGRGGNTPKGLRWATFW